jgi:transposase-like protein
MEARELRKRLVDFRRSSSVRDYPRALVQDVVEYASQRQKMGIKRHRIANELNVAQTTLNRWLQRSQDDVAPDPVPSEHTALVPVRIAMDVSKPMRSRQGVVMTSPTGWRVEVSAIEEAIALLRALS